MTIQVLIADDHAMMRDGVRLLLETQPGIDVIGTASDGLEAIDRAAELTPDVIVMDIGMPRMNGIDATVEILALHPQCKVIILSMHGTAEHAYRALRAGATGYVVKEAAGQELIRAVQDVIVGKRFLSPVIEAMVLDDYASGNIRANEDPLGRLSSRERQVLQLIAEGLPSTQIAATLHLSEKTIATYRNRLMQKLGLHGATELIKFAVLHELTRDKK